MPYAAPVPQHAAAAPAKIFAVTQAAHVAPWGGVATHSAAAERPQALLAISVPAAKAVLTMVLLHRDLATVVLSLNRGKSSFLSHMEEP